MTLLQWLEAGEPAGEPFVFWRHFPMGDVERLGERFPVYAAMFMDVTAAMYAKGRPWRFGDLFSTSMLDLMPTVWMQGKAALVSHLEMDTVAAGALVEVL